MIGSDPIRTTPQGEGLIVAPADGLITLIQRVPVPREMAGQVIAPAPYRHALVMQ